jgi:predicted GNAT family acetyltransferase
MPHTASAPLTLREQPDRLTAEVEGLELLIRYLWTRPGVMRVDHVGVPKALGGRGLGTRLVGALVAKARAEGFKVEPVCSFAATQFTRHPDWADVLV